MDPYKETRQTYDRSGTDYPEGDISPNEADWIQRCLSGRNTRETVLEFGSGLGRRSRYIESLGFRVQRSDASGAFLEHLQHEKPAPLLLDLLEDPLPPSSIFYASAVLLHFSADDTRKILQKIYEATKPGGIFFFSLKEGEGSVLEEGPWGRRYFTYWQEEDVVAALLLAGWEEVSMERDGNWIQAFARRA